MPLRLGAPTNVTSSVPTPGSINDTLNYPNEGYTHIGGVSKHDVRTREGVFVNGYWFPSMAAASEAPAGKGFDFSAAAAAAAAQASARAEQMKKARAWTVFYMLAHRTKYSLYRAISANESMILPDSP